MRPGPLADVPVAEPDRDIVDELCHLEALELPIPSIFGISGSPAIGCFLLPMSVLIRVPSVFVRADFSCRES